MSSSLAPGAALIIALALLAWAGPAGAKVFYSQKEALDLAFPEADRIEKKTYVLDDDQVAEVEQLARSRVESRLVSIHTAWRGEALIGYANIDVHTVRTQPEGFMVVLDPNGVVKTVRILAFHEPLEYLPTGRWYDRLAGKRGTDPLRVGRDVDAVTGATLSARAATDGVRRVLAYYTVLLRD